MSKSIRLAICKVTMKEGGWWVIDTTWGIMLKHWARTRKEAVNWCNKHDYDHYLGGEY